MSNTNQATGQNVDEEASQELMGGNGHDLLLAAVGIVSPAERDAIIFEGATRRWLEMATRWV